MPQVSPFHRHVDDGTRMRLTQRTLLDGGALGCHHLLVAHAHTAAIDRSPDALSGNLLHVFHLAAVGLVGISLTQGDGDGMGGIAFHVGGEVEQILLAHRRLMNSLHLEYSTRQRTCLVEDHRRQLVERIHIVAALDEDALTRGATNAAEEAQWHRDDQCARTAHHQEAQRTVSPCRQTGLVTAVEQWRNEGKAEGEKHHDGRIDAGETTDERLALRLILPRGLNKLDNL